MSGLRPPRNDEAGNALWFILVAIGLLGLLTVMMSRSSSTSNETGSYEQSVITANDILQYAQSLEIATQNLLARGCSENELSFWHDSDGNGTENGSDDYYNASAPTDRSCHVFDVAGAGMTYEPPNEKWLDTNQSAEIYYGDWLITGHNCIVELDGSNCLNTSSKYNDLLIILPWVSVDLCVSINKVLKTNTSSGAPPQDDETASYNRFTGSFVAANKIEDSDDESILYKKNAACFEADQINANDFSGTYHFYHALHTR